MTEIAKSMVDESQSNRPVLFGRGGPGRGQGRKPGVKNKYAQWFKEGLAGENGSNLELVQHRYLQLALVEPAPVFDKKGKPVMIAGTNKDGSPMLDRQRKPVMVQKLEMLKNVPYAIQMQALDRIHDIVLGPIKAGDKDEGADKEVPIARLHIHLSADKGVEIPTIDGTMREIVHVDE